MHQRPHHPKYLSGFIKLLDRKVLFTDPIFLHDVKLGPELKIDVNVDVNVETKVGAGTFELSPDINLYGMLAFDLKPNSAVSVINRYVAKQKQYSVLNIAEYVHSLKLAVEYNNRLDKYLTDMLPVDFNPKTILEINLSSTYSSVLSSKYPKAKIATKQIDSLGTDSYDLVIVFQCVKRDAIKNIIAMTDEYCIVCDFDIDSNADPNSAQLANFAHELYPAITGRKKTAQTTQTTQTTHDYSTKEQILQWFGTDLVLHAENEPTDVMNPLGQYAVCFKVRNLA